MSLSGMGCVCAEHTLPPPDSMCHVSANLYQDNRTGVAKPVKVAAFLLSLFSEAVLAELTGVWGGGAG